MADDVVTVEKRLMLELIILKLVSTLVSLFDVFDVILLSRPRANSPMKISSGKGEK